MATRDLDEFENLSDDTHLDAIIPSYAEIPHTLGWYIEVNGTVRNSITNEKLIPKTVGEGRFIDLPLTSGESVVLSVDTIHRIAFGKIKIPFVFWSKLRFAPGTQSNLFLANPESLKYVFGGKNFTIIPGFSIYGLSEDNEVYNVETNKLLSRRSGGNPIQSSNYVTLTHDSSGDKIDVRVSRLRELILNK